MKIIVGIKHVPDTETKVSIHADGRRLDPAAVSKWIISPYDEFALEEALRIRDAAGEGAEVVAVSVGPEACQTTLRTALATGADRAVLVADDRFDDADAIVRARALAATARAENADVVLFGKYGVGTDEGQTGAMVAELLGWPHVAAVTSLELVDGAYSSRRAVEGAVEIHEGTLPALFTCEKGLNDPRYPSLKGIMQAKKKPIDRRDAGDLGVEDALAAGPRIAVDAMDLPQPKAAGVKLDGEPAQVAAELVRRLHEEAKVL